MCGHCQEVFMDNRFERNATDETPSSDALQIDYLFDREPRRLTLDGASPPLTVAQATLHVLQLHFGDSENSLLMPAADASAEQIQAQAAVVGISEVRVRRASAPV
jgi:hypothetical protein